jgi:hypothetical protein
MQTASTKTNPEREILRMISCYPRKRLAFRWVPQHRVSFLTAVPIAF